jgi:poly(3-hydroxybutyrate) depolymerase
VISNARDEAITVFPQGIPWQNYGVGWAEPCDDYDMAFFDNMLKYLSDNYCVNPNKIFVSGFSWGGDMTNALACCRGDKIRAIAPISGPERMNSTCPVKKWPATWMRYGTNDEAYSQSQFTSTRDFYISKLACNNTPQPLADDSQCASYSNCSEPLTVCARPLSHQGVNYPKESEQIWDYWRTLPDKK